MSSGPSLEQILATKRDGVGPIIDVDEPKIKLLILTLAEESFAIRGEFVREVLPDVPVFYLPGCPASLEGVINLRDEIETVVDLRRVLGLVPQDTHADTRILLIRTPAMQSGVRVDRVDDVTDVPQSALLPPPVTIDDARKPLVQGVVQIGTQMATLLDIERIFSGYLKGGA